MQGHEERCVINMHKDYVKNLLLLCLGKEDTFQTKTTTGFTCDCPTAIYNNRVIVHKNFDPSELTHARKYHKKNSYALWIDSEDTDSKQKLHADGFTFCFSYPEMMLDLSTLSPFICDSRISIRRVISEDEILATWAPLVVKAYNPQVGEDDFKKYLQDWHTFFKYLRNSNSYNHMYFVLGYWDEVPAATGLFIVKDDAAYIHKIGSLTEFRRKGLALAITSLPLIDFRKNGIQKAFLFASVMGKPLYEKIGFTTIGQVDVYKTKE
jgi:ribosomal protein S18 acetylase RimI-like enzyme